MPKFGHFGVVWWVTAKMCIHPTHIPTPSIPQRAFFLSSEIPCYIEPFLPNWFLSPWLEKQKGITISQMSGVTGVIILENAISLKFRKMYMILGGCERIIRPEELIKF